MLGGTEPVDRIRAAFFANHVHLIADFVDRLFPADANPLATLFFHRVFQTAFAMGMFAHRSTFGAVRPKVERAVPTGFLSCPDAIGNLCDDRTANRTMGAHRFDRFDRAIHCCRCRGLGDGAGGCGYCCQPADRKAGTPQE